MTGKRKHPSNAKRHFKRAKYKDGGASKLEPGMCGILVSHDRNKEKSCRIDCFRLLNHFGDKLYGPEKKEEMVAKESDSENDDIEGALSSEINEIKGSLEKKSLKERRFFTVKSGCNNLIFVRFRDASPSVLMKNIVESIFSCQNLEEANIPYVGNVLRVHPVEFSCPAYLDNMCKNIPPFLEQRLSEMADAETKEYTIEYKCRNNSHLSRQSVLDGLSKVLKDSQSGWKYNCRTQSVSVIIDILKTVCLVSVVKDYYCYKRYNIRELLQKSIPESSHLSEAKTQSIQNQDSFPEACEEDNHPDSHPTSTGESFNIATKNKRDDDNELVNKDEGPDDTDKADDNQTA